MGIRAYYEAITDEEFSIYKEKMKANEFGYELNSVSSYDEMHKSFYAIHKMLTGFVYPVEEIILSNAIAGQYYLGDGIFNETYCLWDCYGSESINNKERVKEITHAFSEVNIPSLIQPSKYGFDDKFTQRFITKTHDLKDFYLNASKNELNVLVIFV